MKRLFDLLPGKSKSPPKATATATAPALRDERVAPRLEVQPMRKPPPPRKSLGEQKGTRKANILPNDTLNIYLTSIRATDKNLKKYDIVNTNTDAIKYLKYKEMIPLLEKKLKEAEEGSFYDIKFKEARGQPEKEPFVKQYNSILADTRTKLASAKQAYNLIAPEIAFSQQQEGLKTPAQYIEDQAKEKEDLLKLQTEAQALYTVKGPLCDSEGFYQHYGECWSDALQQVLLNTDGLKEILQDRFIKTQDIQPSAVPLEIFIPKFYKESLSINEKQKRNMSIRNDYIFLKQQRQWVNIYLKEVQKRFLRHYITEATRRAYLETCSRDTPPAKIARKELQRISMLRRKAGKEGVGTAIFGRLGRIRSENNRSSNNTLLLGSQAGLATLSVEKYKEKSEIYAGGTIDDLTIILNIINHLFFSNEIQFLARNAKGFGTELHFKTRLEKVYPSSLGAMLLAIEIIQKDNSISGHQIAFYTCGSKQFYYENNTGVFPFLWNEFMQKYFALPESTMRFVTLSYRKDKTRYRNVFYPILVYTNDTTETYATFLGSTYVEFTEDTFLQKEGNEEYQLQTAGHSKKTLSYILTITPPKAETVTNVNYQHQLNARLRENIIPTVEDLDQAFEEDDEDEVLDILSKLDIPKGTDDLSIQTSEGEIGIVLLSAVREMNRVLRKLMKMGFNPDSLYESFDQILQGDDRTDKERDESDIFAANLLEYINIPSDYTIPDPKGGAPDPVLTIAVWKGYQNVVDGLIKGGLDASQFPIFQFIGIERTKEFLSGLQPLVESGYNINQKDPESGFTPLMMAANKGDTDLVEFLLHYNADTRLVDTSTGMNALHAACTAGGDTDTSTIVMMLLKAGMNINTPTKEGTTPLALATRYAHPNVLALLCKRGARTNIPGVDPWDKNTINVSNACPPSGGRRRRKTKKRRSGTKANTHKRR